jgi:flagellin-like hook-associated protein FlgL
MHGEAVMQVVAHNVAAMFTENQLKINTGKTSKSVEKLSSGYRINRAADDAAGLSISEKMRRMIRGLDRGRQNTEEGIAWVQIADGAMNESMEMLQRMNELAVQAANGTNSDSDREAINNEIENLKTELNRVSETTKYNDQNIFLDYFCTMEVEGDLNDMQIFNASYDDSTGEVTYGGFVYNGQRVSWDTVSQDMVEIVDGKQVFHGGDYTFYDYFTKSRLNFHCEEGAEVPTLTREISISAEKDGIRIDGVLHSWNELKDENGISCSEGTAHGGEWSIEYAGAKISFMVGADTRSLSEMAKVINSTRTGSVTYRWTQNVTGKENEQAVDADCAQNLRMTNALSQLLNTPGDYAFTVRAGEYTDAATGNTSRGVWLSDGAGNAIDGSFKSWADLKIYSWDSGFSINDEIVYEYNDNDGVNDTNVSFKFSLSDITSEDSVIDGLDGMQIRGSKIVTDYSTKESYNGNASGNVMAYNISTSIPVSFDDEKALGRDFDQKTYDVVPDTPVVYDSATSTVSWTASNAGNDVIQLTGSTSAIEQKMEQNVLKYLNSALATKIQNALAGAADMPPRTLDDVLGTDKITTAGYMDDSVTLDVSMEKSQSGSYGSTYHTAFIDFSGLGTSFNLGDLLETGFDTTCATCTNHYSVKFVNNPGDMTTSSGYQYTLTSEGQNYLLEINLNSLAGRVSTGEDLASAIVEIVSNKGASSKGALDFHFTQYAADGATLYVFDDRPEINEKKATFYTKPYESDSTGSYSVKMRDSTGRSAKLDFDYNFKDAADDITVSLKEDASGNYLQLWDLATGKPSGTYISKAEANGRAVVGQNGLVTLYSATTPSGEQAYSLDIAYASGAADIADAAHSYTQKAIDEMLGNVSLALTADDYTNLVLGGDENPNVAVRTTFESSLDIEYTDKGLRIQNSAEFGDEIFIPRVAINSYILGVSNANVLTEENATKMIDRVTKGISILSKMRSLYGAYQNRLEHTYSGNSNTQENMEAAESRIRDTDMAKEMVDYSANNILVQAGNAFLTQAMQNPQGVLQLLS